MTINNRVFSWFEKGGIIAAINGEDECFIPDVTFRDNHDIHLILNQLILWAYTGNHQSAASGFIRCLEDHLERSDLSKALDIYLTYRMVVEDAGRSLELNEDALRIELADLIRKKSTEIVCNEHLRSKSMQLLDKYPDLKIRVGLKNT